MKDFKKLILENKKISIGIASLFVIVALVLYFFVFSDDSEQTYVLGEVSSGTIVSTVTGTGQVSSLNQVDILPKVSGAVTMVNVKSGDVVKKGQILFAIDSRDAQKKVRDASLDLQSAQSSLNISNKNNDIAIKNAYTSLLNSSFEATPSDTTTAKSAKPTITGNYVLEKEGVINIKTYLSVGGISAKISGLVEGSVLTNSVNPVAIGDSGLFITFPQSISPDLSWSVSIPNKNASNYISNKTAYETALRNKSEVEELDSASLLSIKSKQNALYDAQQELSDYYIRAQFDGFIGNVLKNVGDQASSASSLGTIITKQQVAKIPFNEVDIAKIKTGQKVTATFDAIENLEMTGQVISVDLIGTVSSGVVNYDVTISFDTSDDRIKSGMSTNVSIATEVAQDVIMVPNSALKTLNGNSFLQKAPLGSVASDATGVALESKPEQVQVVKGISDDVNTQIISGISLSDIIVLKTITNATAPSTTSAPSIFGSSTNSRGSGAGALRSVPR